MPTAKAVATLGAMNASIAQRFLHVATVALACSLAACTVQPASSGSTPAATGGAGGNGGEGGGGPAGAKGCAPGSPELVLDGVTREIADEGVALRGPSYLAEVYYGLEIDDQLRAGNIAENLWQRLVAPRFALVGELTDGGQFERETWVRGTATEKATGASAYIGVAPSPKNGVAYPVVAIAADKASFDAQFPSFGSVEALRRYNDFPLSCGALAGKWTTSSATAVDTYNGAGAYTGMSVVSDSLDLGFAADGTYTHEWSASVNGTFTRGTDKGTYTSGAREVVLNGQTEGVTTYDAHFIAVKGGMSLYLVNRQYSGMAYALLPGK